MSEFKSFGGRWRVIREIGKGGQGVVYEVQDRRGALDRGLLAEKVQSAIARICGDGLTDVPTRLAATADLSDAIEILLRDISSPRCALKQLLPIDSALNSKTALSRMINEIETLQTITHPALVKIIQAELEEHWFVMEFFADGPLGAARGRFQGRVLDALRAFRPLVDVVVTLHHVGIVHRDIKPDNVFLAADGRLVLGDCGLAIRLANKNRLTDTYENVGSRDWMPGWAYGLRLDEVRPNFDVFSLGKLLWAMVSGKSRMPLWYFDHPEFDLRVLFPQDRDMAFVHRILAKSIVEHAKDCMAGAAEMLSAVDEAIRALETKSERPNRNRRMRCRFCGIGLYSEIADFQTDGFANPKDRRMVYRCAECGHIESFLWRNQEPPGAWIE